MSDQTVTATHEVVRPGISLGGGRELNPGDTVDTHAWEPDLIHLWEKRGTIRPINHPNVATADAGVARRRREG